MSEEKKIKAGDLYKVITVAGREFEIRYMDCGDFDPESKGTFMPSFPYFDEEPEYTDDGYPFTNRFNDDCEHYRSDEPLSNRPCEDCIYFQDAVEDIGVCRCTARKLRKSPKLDGKPIRVAVIGNLPTAEKTVQAAYKSVRFFRYERATDLEFHPTAFDLILVKSYEGEGLGVRGLTATYTTSEGDKVTAPVRLLDEPPCRSAEVELSVLVKTELAKKVNGEANV